MTKGIRVAVFSPANMNAIDGSSIWAQTVTQAIAGMSSARATLLLTYPITNDKILRPLLDDEAIRVIEPRAFRSSRSPLPLSSAASALARMARSGHIDAVIVRGFEASLRLARKRELRGRLWPYLTDIPQSVSDIEPTFLEKMATIMEAAPVLLCQTEEMLSFVEANIPSVAGKGRLFPPTIPGDVGPEPRPPPRAEDLHLCYAGKFASAWNTEEMCKLPELLAGRGINATLVMVGDKINKDPEDPDFVRRMRAALTESSGVDWVGGVSRESALRLMGSAHVGLSWRSEAMNQSLELSTKVIEYCAAGSPPILNRTPMHERLFGSDYPLFADTDSPPDEVLERMVFQPGVYEEALARSEHVHPQFTLQATIRRLEQLADELLEGRSE